MTTPRPATAVDRMQQIRGHTARGLKQDLSVRVYADGEGCIEIEGHTFRFASLHEARAMLDEYLQRAHERASRGAPALD